MNNKDIENYIKNCEFPVSFQVFNRLSQALKNEDISLEEISSIIREDQGLTAKILKIINSAFYGFPGRVGTVSQAVALLGVRKIYSITVSLAVADWFKKGKGLSKNFSPEGLWMHSLAVACAARIICLHLGKGDPEELFVCGLLHDIGKLLLFQYDEDNYQRAVYHSVQNRQMIYFSETDYLSVNHAEAGSILAGYFNFPKLINEAIANHHSFNEHINIIPAGIIHLSDILIRSFDIGEPGDLFIPVLDQNYWSSLTVDVSWLDDFYKVFAREFLLVKEIFASICGE